jgi:anti-anti-sigma regulatory factor
MWWRRRPSSVQVERAHLQAVQAVPEPVVLAVTEPLTGAAAERLSGEVERLDPRTPVVIDLTGIPSFDSEGAASLVGLQDRRGGDQVTIVGLRQAAARLTGAAPATTQTATEAGWTIRRLRNLAVVQALPGATADALETSLADAVEQDVAIVVCDLRGVELTDPGAAALAFASGAAAVRGQELLVVNVSADDVGRLRGLGLSATTYVAPSS